MIMGKVLFLFITAVLLCGWGVNASVLSDNYVYKEIIIKAVSYTHLTPADE